MGVLADRIEQVILERFLENEDLVLKRNELANQLQCAPSQISYVLSTRFSNEKGFDVESRRGLGGFVTIRRLPTENREAQVMTRLPIPVSPVIERQPPLDENMPQSVMEVDHWLGMLLFKEKISHREARMLHSAFEALYDKVPEQVARNGIRHLYGSVLRELRGDE